MPVSSKSYLYLGWWVKIFLNIFPNKIELVGPNKMQRSIIFGTSKMKLSYIKSPNTSGLIWHSWNRHKKIEVDQKPWLQNWKEYTDDSLWVAIRIKVKNTKFWASLNSVHELSDFFNMSISLEYNRGASWRNETKLACKDLSYTTWDQNL